MTNYIIPSSTPSTQQVDLTGLTFPCRITDLRTGTEYVLESAEGSQVLLSPTPVPPHGPTADRPTYNEPSSIAYFDTDLGKPIWYNGSEWVDSTGASADTQAS